MKKHYSMNSKADMNRFYRDLKKEIITIAKENMSIDCPSCGHNIAIHSGINNCPKCGTSINVTIK